MNTIRLRTSKNSNHLSICNSLIQVEKSCQYGKKESCIGGHYPALLENSMFNPESQAC